MRILGTILLTLAFAAAAAAQEREVTDCEVCGGAVYQTPKSYKSGNYNYIYVDKPPHKRYCIPCQRDINNGKIDPNDPPLLSPRDDEEIDNSDNPYAVDKFDWEKKKKPEKDEHTKEAESGFGALGWVIGILVALGLLVRFFLK